jgi:glycolate oxidase iron-sulfur subunit
VLRQIDGLELREIAEGELCCGSAGIYNLLEPETAAELGERKARNVMASGADLVATANPGCLLQVRASLQRLGHPMALAHPIELLDASQRGLTPNEIMRTASL